MKNFLRRREVKALREAGCPDAVVLHCVAVSRNAKNIANAIKKKGHEIDVDFVESASLLHDIGRSKTHGVRHGIEGADILRGAGFAEKYARVCENHIGAGIGREEARELGLPEGNYIPETIEEKVIAHADNCVEGDKVVDVLETVKKLEAKLGKNHPAVKRVLELSDYINTLIDK